MSIRTMAMHGVTRQSLLHGAWPWIRMCVQTTTVVLLAVVMEAPDFGRYATALALASCVAPLLVAGPAFVYLDSHAAFGSTREQIAKVWTRALFVFGFCAALGVAAGMALFAGAWEHWGLWCLVGISEIVLLGFVELRARRHQAAAEFNAMGAWQAAPHVLRLGLAALFLTSGRALPLATWVWVAFGATFLAALGAGNVKRQDAPRGLDSLMRLARVGFRYGSYGVNKHAIADGDKVFVARIVSPVASGALFLAQRLIDLVCFPLQVAIVNALPRLLEAEPEMRPALWRRALLWPGLYAVAASASLIAISPLLRNLGPHYTIAMMAMAWLWWVPILGFLRGTLGNAAVLAGRGDAYVRALFVGALMRVIGAICLLGLFGWEGALLSLLLAEVASILCLLAVARKPRAIPASVNVPR